MSCGILPTSTGGFFSGFGWILKIFTSRVTPGPVVLVELLRPQYRQSPAMPRPVEPQPVGKPSRSPPLHSPVAGSRFDGAVGTQCSHSKLRNSPSFFAATNAPACASFGDDVGSRLPCASMRPPGSLSNGMSKVVNVAGTQSATFPLVGFVHDGFWPLARGASATAANTTSPAREMCRAVGFELIMCPRQDRRLIRHRQGPSRVMSERASLAWFPVDLDRKEVVAVRHPHLAEGSSHPARRSP